MTEDLNDPWTALAQAAQNGDKRSYEKLLAEIALFVKKSIAGSLASPDWVEDITQEVLISVHKSLHTYSPDRAFKPWLMAIVQFRRTDFLRRHYAPSRQGGVTLDHPDFIAAHVTKPEYAGEYKDVERLIGALPRKQKDIFLKIRIQGHSIAEVASQMKMSESAVKVSLHRTLIRLRAQFEGHNERITP